MRTSHTALLCFALLLLACSQESNPIQTPSAKATADCTLFDIASGKPGCEVGQPQPPADTTATNPSTPQESVLSFRPDELDFGEETNELNLSVKNLSRTDTVRFAIGVSNSFVSIAPSTGTLPPRGLINIQVSIRRPDDLYGPQEGYLSVSVDESDRVERVPVTFTLPNPTPRFIAYGYNPQYLPGGQYILYVRNESSINGDTNIRITDRDRTGWPRLTSRSGNELDPVISPNGYYVAYIEQSFGVVVMGIEGDERWRIPNASNPVWYRDYRNELRLAYAEGNSHIYSVDADGHDETALLPTPVDGILDMVVSPNGRRIAFLRDSQSNGEDGLWLLELLADGDTRFARLSRSRRPADNVTNLAYHFDNRRLFYSTSRDIRYIDTTYRAGKVVGVNPNPPAQPLPPSEIFVDDLKGALSWSPDGRRVAIVAIDNSDNRRGLYIADADGSNIRKLTPNAWRVDVDHAPDWSPDGQHVLFSTEKNKVYELLIP